MKRLFLLVFFFICCLGSMAATAETCELSLADVRQTPGGITATATINGKANENGTLFFAAYQDDMLLAVTATPIVVPQGAPVSKELLLEAPGAETVKLYLFRTGSLLPMAAALATSQTEPAVTKYTDTIEAAQRLGGAVQGSFQDGARQSFEMRNATVSIAHQLQKEGQKQISSLKSPSGGVYLENTMDAYITDGNGQVYYGKNSWTNGRMNQYRMGLYYADLHILDQEFATDPSADEATAIPVLGAAPDWNVYMMSKPVQGDGFLSSSITDATDPYIYRQGLSIDANRYNTLEVTVRHRGTPSNCFLYVVAGNYNGFNAAQHKGFSLEQDNEIHTYRVPLSDIAGYEGTLKGIRFDFSGQAGDVIELYSVRLLEGQHSLFPAKLEKLYHTYSDKVHQEIKALITEDTPSLSAFGTITRIPQSRVQQVYVADKNGSRDTFEGMDSGSVACVGFDIADAGVFGFILPKAENNGVLTVTVEDGDYVIRQEMSPLQPLKKGDILSLGARIYTDETHTFAQLQAETEIERNPLQAVSVYQPSDAAAYQGYNPMRGCYEFTNSGFGFNEAYYNRPDKHFHTNISMTGAGRERTAYVLIKGTSGSLESASVLDQDKALLPIMVQVSKNFNGEYEEKLYDPLDAQYGESILPVRIKPEETFTYTVTNQYQNWGKFPLKQLSSIQFIAPYYHLSTGVTESNCIAPYFVFKKDAWILPDFRGRSGIMWGSQPQFDSFGRLYIPQYHGVLSEVKQVDIGSVGPVYADYQAEYETDDGKAAFTLRHVELPQTDENRTYYSLHMEIREPIAFEDFSKEFSLFKMDTRSKAFYQCGYLAKDGKPVVVQNNLDTPSEERLVLGKEAPYFSFFQTDAATSNFALIVKRLDATIGGAPYNGNLVFQKSFNGAINQGSLSLDLGKATLLPGDTIDMDYILLPWGHKDSQTDENVRAVRQDSVLSPVKLTAINGNTVPDPYVPTIEAIGGRAEFTLSGGANNTVVKVTGLSSYQRPAIYELVEGVWTPYETSKTSYDGMEVQAEDGYCVSFVVPMEGQGRTFRVIEK